MRTCFAYDERRIALLPVSTRASSAEPATHPRHRGGGGLDRPSRRTGHPARHRCQGRRPLRAGGTPVGGPTGARDAEPRARRAGRCARVAPCASGRGRPALTAHAGRAGAPASRASASGDDSAQSATTTTRLRAVALASEGRRFASSTSSGRAGRRHTQLPIGIEALALAPLDRVQPPRLALAVVTSQPFQCSSRGGWSRKNCTHANEHASAAVSGDAQTAPPDRPIELRDETRCRDRARRREAESPAASRLEMPRPAVVAVHRSSDRPRTPRRQRRASVWSAGERALVATMAGQDERRRGVVGVEEGPKASLTISTSCVDGA